MKKRRRKRHKRRIRIGRVFLLFLPVILSAVMVFSLSGKEEEPEYASDPVYLNDYDYSHLSHNNGLYSYEDDAYTSLPGIDVSYSQASVDWQKVYDSGVRFVLIRAGYRGYSSGELHEDDRFRENLEQAKAAGLLTGVYWFSSAITKEEAEEEADYVLDLIGGEEIDLPIGFDMEYVTDNDRIRVLDQEGLTAMPLAFSRRMKENGHEVMVYGSQYWLENQIRMSELQDEVSFWLASYNVSSPDTVHAFSMWQYSESGSVEGIDGKVDMDLWFIRK